MNRAESVLVLHGLWMNRIAMQPLTSALRRAGFDGVAGHYRSMRGTLEENVMRVQEQVTELLAARGSRSGKGVSGRVHIVGHSLGGILALALLRADPERYGRVVLLGSPVGGCLAARQFAGYPGASWLLGETAGLWNALSQAEIPHRSPVRSGHAAGAESTAQEGVEVGSIAGSETFGLAHFFVGLPGVHDGVVRVEETQVPGLADHLLLPVSHTGMLLSDAVAAQCIAFLLNGRFSRR